MLYFLAGKGCVYTYDAVGSYERVGYSSQGSGQQLLMPVLDNQLQSASPLLLPVKVNYMHGIYIGQTYIVYRINGK